MQRDIQQTFFCQYFCKLLKNSCSVSKKHSLEIFRKFTKKTRGESYFSKVEGIYRSNQQRCYVKKGVFRKVFTKFTKNTRVRDPILIKLQAYGSKKRLWRKRFPLNLAKFLRSPFLQNTSRRLLLLLAFQNQPPEVFCEKKCS